MPKFGARKRIDYETMDTNNSKQAEVMVRHTNSLDKVQVTSLDWKTNAYESQEAPPTYIGHIEQSRCGVLHEEEH
jgi:hypothetical protein